MSTLPHIKKGFVVAAAAALFTFIYMLIVCLSQIGCQDFSTWIVSFSFIGIGTHWPHWHRWRWRCLIASDSFKEPLKGLPILYTLTRSPSLPLSGLCMLSKLTVAQIFACAYVSGNSTQTLPAAGPHIFRTVWEWWAGLDLQQLDFSSSSNFIGFLIAFANRKQFNIEFLPVTSQGYAHTQNAHLCCIFFSGIYRSLFFWGIFCTFCADNRYQRG